MIKNMSLHIGITLKNNVILKIIEFKKFEVIPKHNFSPILAATVIKKYNFNQKILNKEDVAERVIAEKKENYLS